MKSLDIAQISGIVPLVVSDNVNDGLKKIDALRSSGFKFVEVALRTAVSQELLVNAKQLGGIFVGAGTVTNASLLEEALTAGSDFIVTPGLSSLVISECSKANVPIIPGVATPSEVMQAMDLGLSYVKLFPAEKLGGTRYIENLSGPFPKVKFMPSGGLNSHNFQDYLANSSVFSVSGSWMFASSANPEEFLGNLRLLLNQIETFELEK